MREPVFTETMQAGIVVRNVDTLASEHSNP